MESKSIARISQLERLPTELIRAILKELTSVPTLRSAILSCRLLYNSFTGDSSAIARRVLLNELDLCDVRPEAIAVLMASRLSQITRSSAREFYRAHLQNRDVEVYVRLTLNEVARLSELHLVVSSLAEDFAYITFEEPYGWDNYICHRQPQPLELSTLEKHRNMRMLYALQLFFKVFGQFSMHEEKLVEGVYDFILNFALLELETIARLRDFLHLYGPTVSTINNNLYFTGLVNTELTLETTTYNERSALVNHASVPEAQFDILERAWELLWVEILDILHMGTLLPLFTE
ncbi:hypothetical protein GGS20DRAFT_535486 [Poronia punctata]|nr:hypothetical protein GGS20DRAFT_535486 [Poronia punctata]